MSDQLKPQESPSVSEHEQQEIDQSEQMGEAYQQFEHANNEQYLQQPYNYNTNNNFSQRGARNSPHNRQGQQRGGRYGSNKYNYNNNNASQYNRYNNGNMGNANRTYQNSGYKSHRGNMNAAAAAAMNIQWQGYYNPQVYYMAPQIPPANSGTPVEMSSSTSPISSSASSSSTPTTKKIEITTKAGEHLDLTALHTHHPAGLANNTTSNIGSHVSEAETFTQEAAPEAISKPVAEGSISEGKPADLPAAKQSDDTISEAEKTRREFLEQIKLRKAALEKRKQEQLEALKIKSTEVKEVSKNESKPKEQPVQEAVTEAVTEEPLQVANESASAIVEEDDGSKDAPTSAEVIVVNSEQNVDALEASTEGQNDANNKHAQHDINEEVVPPKQEAGASEDIISDHEEEIPAENEIKSNEEESQKVISSIEGDISSDKELKIEEPSNEPKFTSTVTQLLDRLKIAKPIEDIYAFKYPADIESPDPKYQKTHIKYTYGPAFLLQFKDKIKTEADDEWVQQAASKIVIPAGSNKVGRPRDPSLFNSGGPGRMNSGGDFRKSGSMRNMDGRSNSRNSSKKKSKRMVDDRRSNRSYTSRRDRERAADRGEDFERRDEEKPKEDVAPLVPSANRWVPKSKKTKTEKKLAPDGVTELLEKEDAERKMKSLLNKLTLEMFDHISAEILSIANQSKWEKQGETLNVVIEEIFHKACDEPHWSSMYAQLCGKVVKELDTEIVDETNEGKNGPKLVLHYLVARCHAEFDKGWADKLPANEDGTQLEPEMMSDEYYKAAAAKRRGLGLVRFIGFLYRLNLLTGKMMFECFRRLMKDLSNTPSEETLESVVELLSTVGEQFETDSFSAGQATLEGSALLDSLFANLQNIIDNGAISNRMKFKLIDIKELREDKHWNSNKKEDGPKTIQQIHEEDEKQRQMKNNSRSNSRRMNNSMGGRNSSNSMGGRNSSRRDVPVVSKDSFISTRSSSLRHAQKPVPKEEPRQPQLTATNMFSALMDNDEED